MKITIIGDGAMATVSAGLLAANGHALRLWSPFPEAVAALRANRENTRYLPGVAFPEDTAFTDDEADAFDGAQLVLAATPTQYIRATWGRLAPHCPAGIPIVSVAKGIENGTLLRPTQVLRDVLGDGRPLAALSGPNIARELAEHLPATATVAAENAPLAACVQALFSTRTFRVYTNPDLVGVELGGAVKNVVAIAAGILDGLGAGDNAKAALLTRGLVEIARLGVALGARRETFMGLSGLGDLVTTCVSPHGRNRTLGEAIGRGETMDAILARTHSVVEGVATTRSVLALASRHKVDMPITEAVHAVLFEAVAAAEAIDALMTRRPKGEDAEWA
ncbi:MAG: NAD(P)-dependent glycerol-3-phosphate dehydrogenase [Planctomycetes bacterium]|nr:NAD(P)-dependent glycerol-3-phosphate dehydrogenase [Planctomycetota bacterium]